MAFHRFVVLLPRRWPQWSQSLSRVRHGTAAITVYDTGADTGPACTPYEAGTAWPGGGPRAAMAAADSKIPPGRKVARDGRPRVPRSDIDTILTNTCGLSKCHGLKPGAATSTSPTSCERLVSHLIQRDVDRNPKMKAVRAARSAKELGGSQAGGAQARTRATARTRIAGAREPQESAPLPAADFIKIVEWIRQGAQQD